MLTPLLLAAALAAPPSPPAAAELEALLKAFLAGASTNDPAAHERFWADDLVYTSSSGKRIGKADILKDVKSAPAPKPGDPATTYTAEDIRIQQYGDVALVAFRLVGTTRKGLGSTEVASYLNTGTFTKRNGEWRAVGWQATHMADPAKDSKQEAEKKTMRATGTFEVKLSPLEVHDMGEGAKVGRMSIEKKLSGDLSGTSKGEMLTAGTDVKGSAGYVAVERFTGTLQGKSGSFTLQHNATMNRGEGRLAIEVVPDSGTGELAGIIGTLAIEIADGKHSYAFEYALPAR
jgi:ketosteroid isomerase-like protein